MFFLYKSHYKITIYIITVIAIISANLMVSLSAKPYISTLVTPSIENSKDIEIVHISQGSTDKQQVLRIQHPLSNTNKANKAIIVAIASSHSLKNNPKAPQVVLSGKTMHLLNNASKDAKGKSKHFQIHWYYLLEQDFPQPQERGKKAYQLVIQHNSRTVDASIMTLSNVSQTPPEALVTQAFRQARTLDTQVKTQANEILLLDMIMADKSNKVGQFVPDYRQKRLWQNDNIKVQASISSRTINTAQNASLTWRWYDLKGEAKGIAVTSIIAFKPAITPSNHVDAGEPQTIAVWKGPALMPKLKKPAYRQPFTDPTYKTTITRITDEKQSGYNNNTGTLRHNYPNDQVWNADMSLIKLNFGQIRDAKSYEIVREISKDSKTKKSYDQILWSNVDADILYGLYENTFNRYSLKTGKWAVLHTFEGYGQLTTDYMSSLSTDDRYIALHDEEQVLVYDLVDDKITGTMPMGGHVTTASMSQSGKYVLVTSKKGFFAYNQQLKMVRKLSPKSAHDDFGYDADGNEVVIQMCPTRMIQIDNGKITDLLGLSYVCGHVSARNYKKPGWAYVSSQLDTNDKHYGSHISTEIMEIKLDDSGIVNTLAHSRTSYHDYAANALLGVSPDGSKIIFHSDWMDEEATVYSYVIDNKKTGIAQTTLQGKINPTHFASNKPLQITWQKLSGKGQVIFNNPHALSTTASFSHQGAYVLQLRVGDGTQFITDNVVITVGKM